jgi:hypothetical protein
MTPEQHPNSYVEVDFVALGQADNAEESRRMNETRRVSFQIAAQMATQSEEFAALPPCFHVVVAGLVAVGAEPSNLLLNTATDNTHYLFGTIRGADYGWYVFQAKAPPGARDDTGVQLRHVGDRFSAIEDALDALAYVQATVIIDRDFIRRSDGGSVLH